MAFVKAGFQVPPRTLVAGVPGKVIRTLTADEISWKSEGTLDYQKLARRCAAGMRPAKPLTAAEPNRLRVTDEGTTDPLYMAKARFS
jgi:phenylacetic acid degradation protein